MPLESIQVEPAAVAGQQQHHGTPFPLVLQCHAPDITSDGTVAWIREHRETLMPQAAQHGAILFRDFPLASAEDFDAFLAAWDLLNFPYDESLSNAVRVNYTPRVFSANEAPPDVTIHLHHEMAQTPIFPRWIFFFCEQPAEQGGQTPLCRSDVLVERLEVECPEFVRSCREKGLTYSNVMPAANDPESGMGRSWQSTLRAETREQAESRLAEMHYSWEWQADGCLRMTTPVFSAIREVAPGRSTFFNQLLAAYLGWSDSRNDPSRSIRHGDGTPLDADAITRAAALAEQLTFDMPWQPGDVVLLDNLVTMHGRRIFQGSQKRKVLASLAAPQQNPPLRTP